MAAEFGCGDTVRGDGGHRCAPTPYSVPWSTSSGMSSASTRQLLWRSCRSAWAQTRLVVDKDEQMQCAHQRDLVKKRQVAARVFDDDGVSTRCEVRPAASGKASESVRGAAVGTVAPAPLPAGTLDQSQLRPLVPARGHICRNNAVGGREAHYPPFRRVSFCFAAWGPRGAAIRCLRCLWESHCTYNPIPRGACPLQGLWDDHVVASVLPASSSASTT